MTGRAGDGQAEDFADVADAAPALDLLLSDAALGIARRLCRNVDDARDLVHDTYERALRNWDRYGEQGNAKADCPGRRQPEYAVGSTGRHLKAVGAGFGRADTR